MAEVTVRLWLLAWPDGRVHTFVGNVPPKKWTDLAEAGECLVHESSATVQTPERKASTPVVVKPTQATGEISPK